jgi:hypothetical protein
MSDTSQGPDWWLASDGKWYPPQPPPPPPLTLSPPLNVEQLPDDRRIESTFDSAMEGLRTSGASAETRELVELLARHGEAEGAILNRYKRFAVEASAPETRYLVQLILDDERRHHRLMVEMANALAWGISRESPYPAVPDVTHKDAGNRALTEETQHLLKSEEQDRLDLKDLRKRLRPFRDTTMWELLVDIMLMDTDKHIRILGIIAKQCENR